MVILGIIALLVLIVLAAPVRARLTWDRGELTAWASYGPLRFQLCPRPPETEERRAKKARREEQKARKEEKRAQKKKKKAGGAAGEAAQAKSDQAGEEKKAERKKKFRINAEQVLYSLEVLPPILGRALRRTGRSIRLEPLRIHLLVAGTDPAETAELYGKLEAALAAGLPALHRLVRIRDQDIRLFLDFQAEEMDCIADVGIFIRPGSLAGIGLRAGGSILKWLLGFRKLASPAEAGEKETRGAA